MKVRDFLKRLAEAERRASAHVSALAQNGGRNASGLASEGYMGGYLQALHDVDAMLRHGYPTDPRRLWSQP
jgi:hypothetical protein